MHDGHGPGVEFEEFLRASSLSTLQDEEILIAALDSRSVDSHRPLNGFARVLSL